MPPDERRAAPDGPQALLQDALPDELRAVLRVAPQAALPVGQPLPQAELLDAPQADLGGLLQGAPPADLDGLLPNVLPDGLLPDVLQVPAVLPDALPVLVPVPCARTQEPEPARCVRR